MNSRFNFVGCATGVLDRIYRIDRIDTTPLKSCLSCKSCPKKKKSVRNQFPVPFLLGVTAQTTGHFDIRRWTCTRKD